MTTVQPLVAFLIAVLHPPESALPTSSNTRNDIAQIFEHFDDGGGLSDLAHRMLKAGVGGILYGRFKSARIESGVDIMQRVDSSGF
jgi:hypothetical protein